MSPRWLLAALACAWLGCSKSEAKPSGPRENCAAPAPPYQPTATEVPLPQDFLAAAEKRVTSENYRRELARIEREIEASHPPDARPTHEKQPARGEKQPAATSK